MSSSGRFLSFFIIPAHVLAFASGCISLAPEPREVALYVLHVPPCDEPERTDATTDTPDVENAQPEGASRPPQSAPSLWIVPTSARPGIHSTRIAFAPDAFRRGHYQYASWAEPPAERFSFLLARRFECDPGFASTTTRALPSDLVLYTEIVDLHHDTSTEPGRAIVRARAELVGKDGASIATRDFDRALELQSYDARGAVEAMSRAVGEILDEIVEWVRSSAASALGKG